MVTGHLLILFCEVPPACFSIRLSFFFFSFKFFLHILDKGPSVVTCVAKNLLGGISNVQISQFGKDLGGKKKKSLYLF